MCTKDCLLSSIEMLRDEAWHKSLKYRNDPVLGKTHEEYLNNFNVLIEHAKEGMENVSQ